MRFSIIIIVYGLVAAIGIRCSVKQSKDALEYSEDFKKIVKDVCNDFDNLRAKVDSLVDHKTDTLLVNSSFDAIGQFESKLIEHESNVGLMSPFENNDSLKIKAINFIKISREEILPVYKLFLEVRDEAWIKHPISEKNVDEQIRTNENIVKANESLTRAISREYREKRSYNDFVTRWIKTASDN